MAGVLLITPNGTVIEKASINAAMTHITQPDPLAINLLTGMVLEITTDQTLAADITIPAGVELRITNNAVVTLGPWALLIQGEFQKPHYDCFNTSGGGVLTLPDAGPGPLQNWSIKDLIAAGTAAIAGALSGLSAVFTGNVTAAKFIGPLEGNVTGNADTATTATNASGTGTIPKGVENAMKIMRGTGATDGSNNGPIYFTGAGFVGTPTVIVCGRGSAGTVFDVDSANAGSANIKSYVNNTPSGNKPFYWIAIGV